MTEPRLNVRDAAAHIASCLINQFWTYFPRPETGRLGTMTRIAECMGTTAEPEKRIIMVLTDDGTMLKITVEVAPDAFKQIKNATETGGNS